MQNKSKKFKKVLLIILDGFGLGPKSKGNPISPESMPFFDSLLKKYPSFSLEASGLVVGLPWGVFGNSEVGHSAIGVGEIVVQDLARINNEIKTGAFFKNSALVGAMTHSKKFKSDIHIIGCVSPGGIHSHEDHLAGLLKLFASYSAGRVYVHMITDGEDSNATEGVESIKRLHKPFAESKIPIASVIGRKYGMDRVQNWPLTEKVWKLLVENKGSHIKDPTIYLQESYAKKVFDDEIEPVLVDLPGGIGQIKDNDSIVFFNYRNDRMRQLVASFLEGKFDGFERKNLPKNLYITTMTKYDENFTVPVAYEAVHLPSTLGAVVSKNDLPQLRIAEGEKGAHVTNFFNGGKLDAFPKEERIIVPSRKMGKEDYIKHPEMSAPGVTQAVLDNLDKNYNLFVVNFANADMIAHTGNLKATEKTLNVVDDSLKKIISHANLEEMAIVITADHGNSEELIDPKTGEEDTKHSTANVPMVIIADAFETKSDRDYFHLAERKSDGSLIDVAPTVLELLDIKQPKEMTGSSLMPK